jgi:hypothetical protein
VNSKDDDISVAGTGRMPEKLRREMPDLERLQNFGYTHAGSAIVDALWFPMLLKDTRPLEATPCIGLVLICNEVGIWKAYIGIVNFPLRESIDAQEIARDGVKVSYGIAAGAFPGRFTAEEYDS